MKQFFGRSLAVFALAVVVALPGAALAWPDRPVRIVVPYPPGGAPDIGARFLSEHLSKTLGGTFIVENQPGGNTIVAAAGVAKATPDGYTLLLASGSTMTTIPSLYPNDAKYKPLEDFTPIALVSRSPFFVFASPNLPVKDMKDFIAKAKEKPGDFTYGSNGSGGAGHIGTERLKRAAGIDLFHIPYKSTVPALTDTVAGRLSIVMGDLTAARGFLQDGKLRILSLVDVKRSAIAPDAPTLEEAAGVEGFDASPWFALFGPKGLPNDITVKLNTAITAYLQSDVAKAALEKIGQEPATSSPEELRNLIAEDANRIDTLIREQNITAE